MAKNRHIPALTPDSLTVALQKLQASKLPPAAKKHLAAMLVAAANPNAESSQAVMATLPGERKANAQKTARVIHETATHVALRGRQKLLGMSDNEWQKLVDEANKK